MRKVYAGYLILRNKKALDHNFLRSSRAWIRTFPFPDVGLLRRKLIFPLPSTQGTFVRRMMPRRVSTLSSLWTPAHQSKISPRTPFTLPSLVLFSSTNLLLMHLNRVPILDSHLRKQSALHTTPHIAAALRQDTPGPSEQRTRKNHLPPQPYSPHSPSPHQTETATP